MSAKTQTVTIIVTEDQRSASVELEKVNNWPDMELPHISQLIQEAADQIKNQIAAAIDSLESSK